MPPTCWVACPSATTSISRRAAGAVDDTLNALRDSPKTATAKAKFILATDGDQSQAEDLACGEIVSCAYADFPG